MISLSGDEMVVISFKDGVHNEIDIKKMENMLCSS